MTDLNDKKLALNNRLMRLNALVEMYEAQGEGFTASCLIRLQMFNLKKDLKELYG